MTDMIDKAVKPPTIDTMISEIAKIEDVAILRVMLGAVLIAVNDSTIDDDQFRTIMRATSDLLKLAVKEVK